VDVLASLRKALLRATPHTSRKAKGAPPPNAAQYAALSLGALNLVGEIGNPAAWRRAARDPAHAALGRRRRSDGSTGAGPDQWRWPAISIAGRVRPIMNNVRSLIEDFADQLAALIETQALDQARAAIERALGVRRPGRPPKVAPLALTAELRTQRGGAAQKKAQKKARKKPPKQFCPVPGCKNVAAPVFGMVCAEHKDVAKAKIKQYREARKAKKLGIKPPKATKSGAAKAAPARAKKPAKPRARQAAKPPNQKAARPKPAKRRPKKVLAPAPAPAVAAKPPVADAA
jgi:hypothetical protein